MFAQTIQKISGALSTPQIVYHIRNSFILVNFSLLFSPNRLCMRWSLQMVPIVFYCSEVVVVPRHVRVPKKYDAEVVERNYEIVFWRHFFVILRRFLSVFYSKQRKGFKWNAEYSGFVGFDLSRGTARGTSAKHVDELGDVRNGFIVHQAGYYNNKSGVIQSHVI